jgi:serine/threonine-protein kinase
MSCGTQGDATCGDRFARAWEAALRGNSPAPDLETYLRSVPDTERPDVRRQLEEIEQVYRRRYAGAGSVRETDTDKGTPTPDQAETRELNPSSPPDATRTMPAGDSGTSGASPGTIAPGDQAEDDTSFSLADVAVAPVGRGSVAGYEILGVLGRGAMGVVYRAQQKGLNRTVALKMIRAGDVARPDELARFRTEAEAVARLQHPNITQVYEVGEHNGCPFLSLEFVNGGSLQKRMAGQPQPVLLAARLVQVLAQTMAFAHGRGVVHRDLKPANVLLQVTDASDGSDVTNGGLRIADCGSAAESAIRNPQSAILKVSDFGLAKRLEEDSGQTRTGAVLGTPGYMAPEQALGQTRDVGPAADQYALGAILYELLTGRPPLQGATVWETLDQVRTQEPVPPSRLQPKVPRDLDTICLKCLQKEPAKRYADCAALAEDLRRFVAGEPIRARPVSAAARLWRWGRRNPGVAALTATVFVLLVACAAVLTVAYFHVQDEKARAEANAAAETEARHLADQSAKEAGQARESADKQRRLALDTLGTLIGKVQEQLRDAPATQRLRRDLLETALHGLQQVAESADTAGLRDRSMAAAHWQLGGIFEQLGQDAAALAQYRKVHEILAAQARAQPDSDLSRGNLALSLHKLGEMSQRVGGDVATARRYYEQALALRRQIVERPHGELPPAEARRSLAGSYDALGLVAQTPRRALELYRLGLRLREDDLKSAPNDPGRKEALANSWSLLASASFGLHDLTAARDYCGKALKLRKELAAAAPGSMHLRTVLAISWEQLADLDFRLGNANRARDSYEEARKLWDAASRDDPNDVGYQHRLAQVYYELATVALRLHDRETADRLYSDSLRLREAWVKAEPRNVPARMALMISLARCGQERRAAAITEQLRRQLPDDAGTLFQAACCYALCSSAVGAGKPDTELTTADRRLRERYQEQALDALRQAVKHGYADLVGLETDPDLDAVRPLPGFQEVCEALRRRDG